MRDLEATIDKIAAGEAPRDLARLFRLADRLQSEVLRAERDSELVAVVDAVDVERGHASIFEQQPGATSVRAVRREAELVQRYRKHAERLGLVVRSRKIRPPGETVALRTDLYIETTDELCEAKGITTREAVRSAVGQVLDYRRHLNPKSLAVLLPTRPSNDLIAFMHSVDISCIYEDSRGVFIRLDP